jgi:hypothetical protein
MADRKQSKASIVKARQSTSSVYILRDLLPPVRPTFFLSLTPNNIISSELIC